jgi:hypothetical protein
MVRGGPKQERRGRLEGSGGRIEVKMRGGRMSLDPFWEFVSLIPANTQPKIPVLIVAYRITL